MKNQLVNILNVALVFVECCNEYSHDYDEEEKQYREILYKIEKENYQDFSKEEIEILIDACDNAIEEKEINELKFDAEYYEEVNDIVNVQNKLKAQLLFLRKMISKFFEK